MADREPFIVPVTAEAVVQADIGGMSIAFTRVITPEEQDPWLDQCRKSINRQRAQHELVEALVDIEARKQAIDQLPERLAKLKKERAEERARMIASWQASHAAANRRVEFMPNAAQRQARDTFDQETARKIAEAEADKEKVEAELPHYEARAARARAIIAGKERWETIAEERLAAAE